MSEVLYIVPLRLVYSGALNEARQLSSFFPAEPQLQLQQDIFRDEIGVQLEKDTDEGRVIIYNTGLNRPSLTFYAKSRGRGIAGITSEFVDYSLNSERGIWTAAEVKVERLAVACSLYSGHNKTQKHESILRNGQLVIDKDGIIVPACNTLTNDMTSKAVIGTFTTEGDMLVLQPNKDIKEVYSKVLEREHEPLELLHRRREDSDTLALQEELVEEAHLQRGLRGRALRRAHNKAKNKK